MKGIGFLLFVASVAAVAVAILYYSIAAASVLG